MLFERQSAFSNRASSPRVPKVACSVMDYREQASSKSKNIDQSNEVLARCTPRAVPIVHDRPDRPARPNMRHILLENQSNV